MEIHRKVEIDMKDYEVLVQTVNPCGGDAHDKKELIEVECESPEAWVKANGAYPIMEVTEKTNGDLAITTGDGKGTFVKYTFTN